ncbi:MAG: BLUF domain-containing protein [Gammaproteobacteria bacterium]|nr:BLUF domain-containing protein [Gammaproteobacteria bacterium]
MPDSDLDSLVYVSSATRILNLEEIGYLLKRARERNKEYGLTGVLLYDGGNFMQYLEGPKDNLDVIYKIIQEDKQHTGIILVYREAIEDRQFGDWSMAYQTKDVEGYVGSPSERQLIEMILELPDDNASIARIVLHGFWDRSAG